MSEEKLNIYQRINEIKKEIKYIQKDTDVKGFGAGSYKALSHDMVTASTRELFIKQGVICIPTLVNKSFTEGAIVKEGQGEKQKQGRFDCTYSFCFICIDNPKDFISCDIASQGMDTQDKAPGKALSMAKKLAVLKILDLESGDKEESRIKDVSEFDLQFHIDVISGCESLKGLEEYYLEAKKQATEAKDGVAITTINRHTVACKKTLIANGVKD